VLSEPAYFTPAFSPSLLGQEGYSASENLAPPVNVILENSWLDRSQLECNSHTVCILFVICRKI